MLIGGKEEGRVTGARQGGGVYHGVPLCRPHAGESRLVGAGLDVRLQKLPSHTTQRHEMDPADLPMDDAFFTSVFKGDAQRTIADRKVPYTLIHRELVAEYGDWQTANVGGDWGARFLHYFPEEHYSKKPYTQKQKVSFSQKLAAAVRNYHTFRVEIDDVADEVEPPKLAPRFSNDAVASAAESEAVIKVKAALGSLRDSIAQNKKAEFVESVEDALDSLDGFLETQLDKMETPERRPVTFLGRSQIGKSFAMNLALAVSEKPHDFYKASSVVFCTEFFEDFAEVVEDDTMDMTIEAFKSTPQKCAVIVPTKGKFVSDQERMTENESLRALKSVADAANPNDYREKILPFILSTGPPESSGSVSKVNIQIRHGKKWHVAIQFMSKEEILSDVNAARTIEEQCETSGETAQSDGETKEIDRLVGLLKMTTTGMKDDEKALPKASKIKFKDELQSVFGKTICLVGVGEDATDDRIYLRRAISGILFHGLFLKDWPESLDVSYEKGDGTSALVKSLVIYAPSALLDNVEWIDAPGGDDIDPLRYINLRNAIQTCSGVILMTENDLAGEEAMLKLVGELVVPRLFEFPDVKKLSHFAYFKMCEKGTLKNKFPPSATLDARDERGKQMAVQDVLTCFQKYHATIPPAKIEEWRLQLGKLFCRPRPLLYSSLVKNSSIRLRKTDYARNLIAKSQGLGLLHFLADMASAGRRESVNKICNELRGVIVVVKKATDLEEPRRLRTFTKYQDVMKGSLQTLGSTIYEKVAGQKFSAQGEIRTDAVEKMIKEFQEIMNRTKVTILKFAKDPTIKSPTFRNAFASNPGQAAIARINAHYRYFLNSVLFDKVVVHVSDFVERVLDVEGLTRSEVVKTTLDLVTGIIASTGTPLEREALVKNIGASLRRTLANGKSDTSEIEKNVRELLKKRLVEISKDLFFKSFVFTTTTRAEFEGEYEIKHDEFVKRFTREIPKLTAIIPEVCKKMTAPLSRTAWMVVRTHFYQNCHAPIGNTKLLLKALEKVLGDLSEAEQEIEVSDAVLESTFLTTSVLNSVSKHESFTTPDKNEPIRSESVDVKRSKEGLRALHEFISKQQKTSRLDKAVAEAFGIAETDRVTFLRHRDQWPAFLEGLYSPFGVFEEGKWVYCEFQNDFPGIPPLSEFLLSVSTDECDNKKFKKFVDGVMSNPLNQVPLLLAACEMFNCAFQVRLPGATHVVSCIRPHLLDVPVFVLEWTSRDGWRVSVAGSASASVPAPKRAKKG